MNKDSFFRSRKWLDFVPQNWLLKLLALIITLLIYISVIHQVGTQVSVENVPVQIDIAESLVPLENIARDVTVKLRANVTSRKFSANDIAIRLKTNDAHINGNAYTWTFDHQNVHVPWGTQLESVSPKSVTINMDVVQHKKVPVEPIFQDRNKLPSNIELGKITVIPAEIQIDAPASVLNALKKIRTKPIPLQGISQSFDCDAELDQEHYSKLKLPKTKIMVQVEIVPAERTRTFKNLPVKILTAGSAKQPLVSEIISSPAVSVTLAGPKNLIENLRKEDLVPCIDISKFEKPGRYDIDVHCLTSVPAVRTKQIIPQRITIQLLKTNSK